MLFVIVLSAPLSSFSANRYWVGGGSSNNWNATGNTNWSATSGGANNASVPSSFDDVIFDANSGSGTCNISAAIGTFGAGVLSINTTGFTGTINQGAGVNIIFLIGGFTMGGGTYNGSTGTITIISGGSTQSGGTFNASSGAITITSGGFTQSGGTFNASSSNISIWGAASFTNNGGTFNASTSTLTFRGGSNQTIAGVAATATFYNLVVNKSGGTLAKGGSVTTLNCNDFTNIAGNFDASGFTTFNVNATTTASDVVITAGSFTAAPAMNVTGNWTQNGGTFVPNGGTVNFTSTSTQTIGGTTTPQTFYSIAAKNSSTTTLGVNLTVAGNLSIQNTSRLNAATYNISLGGNWNNSSTNADPFTEGAQTVTFNGTALQTIDNTGDAQGTEFNNVTINNTTAYEAVRLNADVIVNGTMTFTDGHVTASAANTLTIGGSGSVTLSGTPQDSSFVRGPMNHTVDVSTSVTKVFPIGKGNSYRRADLTVDQTPATSTVYTAEVFNSSAVALGYAVPGTLTHVSYIRYFQIDQTPARALDNAQVRLYFDCSGLPDQVEDLPNLAVVKDDGAGNWIDLNGTASGIICGGIDYAGDILSASFTSFSKFTFGNKTGGTNPLPVEFLSFDAKSAGTTVDVSWSTAAEFNSDYFMVQHSADGHAFQDVVQADAAGNSSVVKSYFAVDPDPYPGISYYRLKQVDNDGKFFFSNTVAVDRDGEDAVSVFPNPSGGIFSLAVSGAKDDCIEIVIRDVRGRECYSGKIRLASDSGIITIDGTGKMLPGIYVLETRSGASVQHAKVVIR